MKTIQFNKDIILREEDNRVCVENISTGQSLTFLNTSIPTKEEDISYLVFCFQMSVGY